jgi:hypothetical protein
MKKMNSHGRGVISDALNKFLHEFICLMTAVIVTVFFCEDSAFLLFDNWPPSLPLTSQTYPTQHYRVKV